MAGIDHSLTYPPQGKCTLCRGLFSHQLADLFEFRSAGPGAPFEECGFRGGEGGAGGVHAAEGDIVVELAAGRDGVGGNIDAKAFAEQVVDGLANADMGFNPADEDFPDAAIAPASKNVAAFGAAEQRLRRNRAQKRCQFRRGRSEALRVLLRGCERNAENFGGIDQATNIPDQPMVTGNEREKLGLNIDDEERGVVGVH